MIERLPEGSVYVARVSKMASDMSEEGRELNLDPEARDLQETIFWNSDRMLLAEVGNRVAWLIEITAKANGGEMRIPLLGPNQEDGEGVQGKPAPKAHKTADAFMASMFGPAFGGGGA